MKFMVMTILSLTCGAMVSCSQQHKYIDTTCSKMPGDTVEMRDAAVQCQQFRQAEAATSVYNEAALLLKSYRACLEKYEQVPARAKEYCALYPQALREIGLHIKEEPGSALSDAGAGRGPRK